MKSYQPFVYCFISMQPTLFEKNIQGTQRPNLSELVRTTLNGFLLCLKSSFSEFGAALENIYLFGCPRRTSGPYKFLGGFFVSFESISNPDRSVRKLYIT